MTDKKTKRGKGLATTALVLSSESNNEIESSEIPTQDQTVHTASNTTEADGALSISSSKMISTWSSSNAIPIEPAGDPDHDQIHQLFLRLVTWCRGSHGPCITSVLARNIKPSEGKREFK